MSLIDFVLHDCSVCILQFLTKPQRNFLPLTSQKLNQFYITNEYKPIPLKRFDGYRIVDRAVVENNIEAVTWLIKNGYDSDTLAETAAEHGYLDILKKGKEYGCRLDKWICIRAAEQGHLHILEWAHSNGVELDTSTTDICDSAAETGRIDILKWARKRECSWNENTFALMAKGNHLDMMKWAKSNGCEWNVKSTVMAGGFGNLEALIWLVEEGCEWGKWTCTIAADEGHLNIIQWAVNNNKEYDCNNVMIHAEKSGNKYITTWLESALMSKDHHT